MKRKNIIEEIKSFGVEKEMPGRGDLSEKDKLIKLASETAAEEKALADFGDMEFDKALQEFLKNNPDKTEEDFINAIRRIQMSSGGKVIDFSKYKKDNDWHKGIRKLDLSSLLGGDKTLSSLTESEREAVNNLLRLTLGGKD